ncbi:universal stress protein [Prescottella agglutinans]|uniref:Nucleotide-binding universal stress UspA family protein n=1 Tax=Prescottella agglutinans TaxID=1644129 RepID=A0ABT6M9L0_9NOCA|nr:universal stress protein [Prescottella agglutinans]MDH6280998.1 nucleotide-binding universal stress UspA family protein [Prescottella agglutinans]
MTAQGMQHGAEEPSVARDANAVIVGVDGSEAAEAAVRWAAQMCADRNLSLRIIHALNFSPYTYGAPYLDVAGIYDWMEDEGKEILSRAAAVAREVSADLDISTEISTMGGARWLVSLSEDSRALVLGASGSGSAGGIGSTAVNAASHGVCPVVVVHQRDGQVPQEGPVVVGIDGSPTSERATGVAFEEAAQRGVPLVAIHAWSDTPHGTLAGGRSSIRDPRAFEDSEHEVLSERLAGWCQRYPDVEVQRELYIDGPRTHLLAWSQKAQLVVVGSRGRGGFRGLLLGSTSNELVQKAQCPVMVVRPERS